MNERDKKITEHPFVRFGIGFVVALALVGVSIAVVNEALTLK
jgi:hypothetical protein